MKLAIASLLVGTAAAFAPGATFNARNTALNMATETSEKVRAIMLLSGSNSNNTLGMGTLLGRLDLDLVNDYCK